MESGVGERERCEAIARGIRSATTHLLTAPSHARALELALADLTRAVGCTRTAIVEWHPDPITGRTLCSRRYEWTAHGAVPRLSNPALAALPFEELFPDWYAALLAGRIAGTDAPPAASREALERLGLHAVLLVPIVAAGRPWGSLWFEDDDGSRRFGPDECRALQPLGLRFSGVVLRAAAESELREGRLEAIAANEAKSAFIGTLGHELRTPLGVVVGMTGLLLDTALTSEQREFVGTIRTGGRKVQRLVAGLLDFARIEAGEIELGRTPFSLHEAVNGAVDPLRIEALERGVDVVCTIDGTVPLSIVGDGPRLRQVLTGLAGNAVQESESGTVRVRVGTGGHTYGDYLVFSIEQPAAGSVATDDAEPASSRRNNETGLWLTICRRLVELMGGRLWTETRPGSGPGFHFSLPLEDELDDTVPVRTATGRVPLHTGPVRVLLVEDHVVNQKVALRMLERLGQQADLAVNGIEAVAAVTRVPYDLVLMDVNLPEMDGLEACRRIRALPNRGGVRIVALTACAGLADRDRCLAAGVDDYLAKPVHLDDLRRVIDGSRPGETGDRFPVPVVER